jgi:hypothetical protein
MSQHKFDPTQYATPNDVAYELVAITKRMNDRCDQINELMEANSEDEHRVTQFDRWLSAMFDASPDIEAIKVNYGYGLFTLVPSNGTVLVFEPEYASALTMKPYPIEPDGDIEWDDDFVPKMHPLGVVSCNGHVTEGQVAS